jgi:preprotein translocase SecE subunit
MAKHENKKRSKEAVRSRPGSGVADAEHDVSAEATGGGKRDQPHPDREHAGSGQAVSGGGRRRGFFDIYKPGQGYHTRIGTALGMGALVCWFAYFLYEKMSLVSDDPRTAKIWQVGVAVGVFVSFGLFGYWVLALNRKICDFLIATEGEMKKVNWTSRKEIIGSTKVVVIVMLFMATLLFFVDMFFMSAFSSLGLLKGGGPLEMFFGE